MTSQCHESKLSNARDELRDERGQIGKSYWLFYCEGVGNGTGKGGSGSLEKVRL